MPNAFGLGVVRLSSGTPFVIEQISRVDVDTGLEDFFLSAGGEIRHNWASIGTMMPVLRFTTTAIGSAFSNLGGVDGIAITASNPLEFWFRKRVSGGVYAGATSHVKMQVVAGFLFWRSVRAQQGQVAEVEFECHVGQDGGATNAPIIITKSQTHPADVLAIDEVYTLGPAWINGVKKDSITDLTIESGIVPVKVMTAGVVWPQFLAVREAKPVIRMTVLDLENAADLDEGSFGFANSGAEGQNITGITRVFLTQRTYAGNHPDATAGHIRFGLTVPAGRAKFTRASAQHPNDGQLEIEITPIANASGAAITFATNVAISGA